MQRASRKFFEHGIAKNFVRDQEFGNGGAAFKASVQALGAASTALEFKRGKQFLRDIAQQSRFGLIRLSAESAILANEADAEHGDDAGGEQKGLDVHVNQARINTGGDTTMNRADYQVPGETCLDGDGGGFRVANFTNHNYLRVLAHEGTEGLGIGEILARINLGLADHGQVELDGIFDGADADGGAVALDKVIKSGVNGGGFAGAGWAGQEEQTAGFGEQLCKDSVRIVIKTEGSHVETAITWIEEADDDFLAASGWENRDAQFDTAHFRAGGGMSLLRQTSLVTDQVSHDFQAARYFLH